MSAGAWMTPFDDSGMEWHKSLPSPYTYQESDFCKLVAAVHEFEARCFELEARLLMACEPCAECGHIDWRELDDIVESRATEREDMQATREKG